MPHGPALLRQLFNKLLSRLFQFQTSLVVCVVCSERPSLDVEAKGHAVLALISRS